MTDDEVDAWAKRQYTARVVARCAEKVEFMTLARKEFPRCVAIYFLISRVQWYTRNDGVKEKYRRYGEAEKMRTQLTDLRLKFGNLWMKRAEVQEQRQWEETADERLAEFLSDLLLC